LAASAVLFDDDDFSRDDCYLASQLQHIRCVVQTRSWTLCTLLLVALLYSLLRWESDAP
jgi:hypothetical protein